MAEFAGPRRWRWLLTDEGTGQPLADHEVALDAGGDDFVAFTGLYQYLRWNAVPDRRTLSEAQIVARVGAWAGRELLGETIGRAITEAAPVTIRVEVPPAAGFVLGWPLEIAHAGGDPLAARGDVTFVYDLAPEPRGAGRRAPADAAAAGELRMLAVFSLPTQTSVLALRRERYELARLIRRIGARQQRRVTLSLLQYGVTRKRLHDVVDSGDGWDVLHLSGHGGRGQFLLEHRDGSRDEVGTADLVNMLRPLRPRVKLAVVSACESAAATTAETLRWVGLTEQAEHLEQEDLPAPSPGAEAGGTDQPEAVTGIARALVEKLGCAAVAMRYPVTDDFATAFTADLYERVLGRNQALGTALARAVPEAAGPKPSPARPAICLVTPVLVGAQAAGLTLNAPAGSPDLNPADVKMERFPPEPERFVGRARAMARASAALAGGSRRTGVLLHGMAGSGKTACALELAYRHQDSFQAVAFWKAPERDDQFGGALASLAAALDIQLGDYGFAMSDKITTMESLAAFLPRLRLLLEGNGILLVLDNLETLLTGDGRWRDPRWAPLAGALTGHRGESRVILTSRVPPAELGGDLLVLPVHALALDESVALTRELPGLRGLLHADASPLRDGDETVVARDRGLVRRVLHVVQGHPKLMELADAAAAAGPGPLEAQLATAEAAASDSTGAGALDAFFREGTTSLDAAQFLGTLTTWTTATLDALPEPARLMAGFLACLEDDDRYSFIVEANWADLWRRLGNQGEPPESRPLIEALTAAALIQAESSAQSPAGREPVFEYRMHPGVAQAIRAAVGTDVRDATDTELGEFWRQISNQAREQEGGEAGQIITRAGLAGAPYLLRLKDWNTTGILLDQALLRDESPATVQAALPALRAIAGATEAPEDLAILARTLALVSPVEAEELMRRVLAQAAADGNLRLASSIAGELIPLLRDAGRLREALDFAEQTAEYTRQAGLGPWNQLADQGRRLQILALTGEHRQVLDEIDALQAQMDQLPATRRSNETVQPWNVRETILDTGRHSALTLGEWQQALDLSAAARGSEQARGAGTHEVARFRFNDYGPLIGLGRLDEAERLLIDCQQVFEDHRDLGELAKVLGARADLESARGNLGGAAAFQQTAIRFGYARPDPRIIAIMHFNLANYLRRTGSDPAAQRAHRLAAALLYQLAGMTHSLANAHRALASDLRGDTAAGHLPDTLEEVVRFAEQTEGVRLGQLITALQPDAQAAADTLAQILRTAADMDPAQDAIQNQVRQWEPVITLTVAAVAGDAEASAELTLGLDQLAQRQDWAALVAVLRRILSGERGGDLLDGLDEIGAAIAGQVLARLSAPGH